MTDLISNVAGGRVVSFNDEFFAEAENLLNPSDAEWREGVYTDRGKWMDGWETRRRRDPGHDWCILALGVPGRIDDVTVDTSFFTGNYAESFSLEACGAEDDDGLGSSEWVELIPQTGLAGDATARFRVGDPHRVTYVRLNIFPDGGVARLRVEGRPIPSKDQVCPDDSPVDLVSALVGGEALDASDTHYSKPSNLLRPSDPAGMWDGWETKRRRGPGHDWATFRLGLPGKVESVEVDTRHFRGNAPGWVSIHVSDDGATWTGLAGMVEVLPDMVNVIEVPEPVFAAFLRLDIHPDGGLARLRARGRPDPAVAGQRRLEFLNSLFDVEAGRFFESACASKKWVDGMTVGRPFSDVSMLLAGAGRVFASLEEGDWLEAFAGHPRIGEHRDVVTDREQSGAAAADETVRASLAEANRAYEERFGFTYIVYATGKSAEEMLEIALGRLDNTREEEVAIAADQQRAITATRLRRMLCLGGTS